MLRVEKKMPPKAKSPTRSKSPGKSLAVKGVGKKAPAGSSAVKKAEGETKPSAKGPVGVGGGAKRSPSPKKSGATPAVKKSSTTSASPSAPSASTAKKGLSEGEAAALLQRLGRGYSDRMFQGSHYYRRLRNVIAEKSEVANTKRLLLERRRDKRGREIGSEVGDKRAKQQQLQEDLCGAAFDGDAAQVEKLIARGAKPLKKDSGGNFAVSEAAVNGQTAVVKLLVERYDADPNCAGQFGRTPLWRAAFNSHTDCIKLLLDLGADPRISAQAELPIDKASGDALKVLKEWDNSKTDKILEKRETIARRAAERMKADTEAELDALTKKTAIEKTKYDAAQKRLAHAKQQFESRVFEYDTCRCEAQNPELVQVALNCVKDAEAEITAAEEERDQTMNAYLDSRTVEAETREQMADVELPGTEVPIRQFADVVINDSKLVLKDSPMWPLVIDTTDKIAMFLRYRDTNYLDGCNPYQMKPESIRKALLGAIRYGKPVVLDLKDVPLTEFMEEFFNAVLPNLWKLTLTKQVMQPDVYLKLVKESDGDRYAENRFVASTVSNFMFIVVTTAFVVEDDLLQQFLPYRVVDEL